MGRTLALIALLTASNLASLRARPGPSLALAVCTACAVGVFLATMALASGIERVLAATARPERAVVASSVAKAEATSLLQPHQVMAIRDHEDFAIVSPETVLSFPLPRRERERGFPWVRDEPAGQALSRLTQRGVTGAAFQLRPEVQIVAGRRFEPGKWEMIVGIRAVREFDGLAVGATVRHRDAPHVDWTVVGHFAAGGGRHESEMWVDKAALAAYGWHGASANVAWVALNDGVSVAAIDNSLRGSPRLAGTRLVAERDFFERFGDRATAPLRTFAAIVGAVMALGAISAGIYAAATAVAMRRVEIATLRAIGMAGLPIGAAIVLEAALVAAAGGLLGIVVAKVAFDGAAATDAVGPGGRQLAYDLSVSAEASLVALACAIGVGLVGTIGAVVHATRLPAASVLRTMA